MIRGGLTQREMAASEKCSQSTVRYYLKKYGLRTKNNQGPRETVIIKGSSWVTCSLHGSKHMVKRANNKNRCKKCSVEHVAKRRKKIRQMLIEEHGGSCAICRYSKCQNSLNFHHRDPETKSFNLSNVSKSLERCRKEAEKCVLLCGNCHTEVHAGITKCPLVA
jgi:hypothetical protein